MFTTRAQEIIDSAKNWAFSGTKASLGIDSLLAAIGNDVEGSVRLAQCVVNGDVAVIRGKCPKFGCPSPCPGALETSGPVREIISSAKFLASGEGVPDREHPGLIDIRHLVCAIAQSREACLILGGEFIPLSRDDAVRILSSWYQDMHGSSSIAELVSTLRGLRSAIRERVYGQDHAVHTFIEGLYNSELTAAADKERRRPQAVFVFAGPPGVGKTFLAELSSGYLSRPFKRFDMTGYSDHQAENLLIGFPQSYKDAKPGLLTGFVEKNQNAILLFDEIEKAHLTTMQLFYQILDAGRLEDKFLGRDVKFRDTLIIFTTNAGRSLYDHPNRSGIGAANSGYHKRTILSALENEKNPANGLPAFPSALCSRLSQGYQVMFNHLGINELESVCRDELSRVGFLLEKQYFKQISYDPQIPICLVLAQGGHVDARQLRAEAEKYAKTELFRYFSLYHPHKLEDTVEAIDTIRFEIEGGIEKLTPELRTLFQMEAPPRVLLVADDVFFRACRDLIPEIDWVRASSRAEIVDVLSSQVLDMVLLDLWVRTPDGRFIRSDSYESIGDVDYMPLSARAIDHGREILRTIRQRSPHIPVYLLSFSSLKRSGPPPSEFHFGKRWAENRMKAGGSTVTSSPDLMTGEAQDEFAAEAKRPIDVELFLACVRAGGARGLITTSFSEGKTGDSKKYRDEFVESLLEISRRLYREKKAQSLARERKALAFETSARLDKKLRRIIIGLKSFNLSRVLDANDAGEMVEDVERPTTRFDDVLGAKQAKESLKFIVDWLKNPTKYNALGVRPPKGVLLGGPPGTGKTMLARAVAGESNCAFIEKSATSFVTIWQGSGPKSIRDLFDRARRYSPTVVFVDEIDAIGRTRTGGSGSGRAEEETLNALLTEMDGFRVRKDLPVIILAASNLAHHLDEALTRRFDEVIEVDKPDKGARLEYLKRVVLTRKGMQVHVNTLERIASQTAGMTIADLERIMHQAGIKAAQKESPLTDFFLEEAIDTFRMGAAKELPDKKKLERTARHEAGHALIASLGGNPPVQVTIVGRGNAGGYMERESDEAGKSYTKRELEQMICEAMGGRAAEILYYGVEDGLSTGLSQDLKTATKIALHMVCEFGMSKEFGLVAVDGIKAGPLQAKSIRAAERIVMGQLQRALELLKKHRSHLDRIVCELLEKNRLTREDLARILPSI